MLLTECLQTRSTSVRTLFFVPVILIELRVNHVCELQKIFIGVTAIMVKNLIKPVLVEGDNVSYFKYGIQ